MKGGGIVLLAPPVNVMEELVNYHLKQLLKENKHLSCICPQCINDVLALALNNLPSKYVSSKERQIEVTAHFYSTYASAEIQREVIRSMIVVSANPQHDNS